MRPQLGANLLDHQDVCRDSGSSDLDVARLGSFAAHRTAWAFLIHEGNRQVSIETRPPNDGKPCRLSR